MSIFKIEIRGGRFEEEGEDGGCAYGVVDVGTNHETITTAISTVVDGNDVAGLFIHCAYEVGRGGESDGMQSGKYKLCGLVDWLFD